MATGPTESDALQRGPLFRMSHAVGSAAILATACLLSYWLITTVLTCEYSISRDDDLLGGMWAVVATIFVYRSRAHQKSARAALSRTVATLESIVGCLGLPAFLPVSRHRNGRVDRDHRNYFGAGSSLRGHRHGTHYTCCRLGDRRH
jgi:hypothetical protein